jgi:chloride channel 7
MDRLPFLRLACADNARLALGRKANLGLVDSSEARLLRRTLPFVPFAAYDPTAGELRDH